MRAYLFMWRVAVLTAVYLFGFWAFLYGQSPPATVPLDTAVLRWTWTQGTGGPVEKWIVRCGTSSGNYSLISEWPNPAARSVFVKQVVPQAGTYSCIVQAANVFGAGGASPEVTFQAGQTPGKVDTLTIEAQ